MVVSLADTVIVCVPVGVPGVLGVLGVLPPLDADPEPHPASDINPPPRNSTATTEYILRRVRNDPRPGKSRRNAKLNHAIVSMGLSPPRCVAAEGAVVVIVSFVVAAIPPPGVTDDGENAQAAPVGRVPQEKPTVPLYPATGVTVSVATTD